MWLAQTLKPWPALPSFAKRMRRWLIQRSGIAMTILPRDSVVDITDHLGAHLVDLILVATLRDQTRLIVVEVERKIRPITLVSMIFLEILVKAERQFVPKDAYV